MSVFSLHKLRETLLPLRVIANAVKQSRHAASIRIDALNGDEAFLWIASSFLLAMTQSDA
jgi:hypothetical protein